MVIQVKLTKNITYPWRKARIVEWKFEEYNIAASKMTSQVKYYTALGWKVYWNGFAPTKVLLARKVGEELSLCITENEEKE